MELCHLPLKELKLAENNSKNITEKNISSKLNVIELTYEQLKNNSALLNEVCPQAYIPINFTKYNPEKKQTLINSINSGIKSSNNRAYQENLNDTIALRASQWYRVLIKIETPTLKMRVADMGKSIEHALKMQYDKVKNAHCSIL